MRPIDAEALMDTIRQHEYQLAAQRGTIDYGMFTIGIQQAVDEQPTINPDDLRPRGRWICKNKAYGEYECSACGGLDTNCSDYYSSHDVTEQDYCPNCGAYMKERHFCNTTEIVDGKESKS